MTTVTETQPEPQSELKQTKRSPLVVIANAALHAEKTRVMAEVRLAHLHLRGRTCLETENLLVRAREFEGYADKRLAVLTREHPAYFWFSRVSGTGGEAIGKVLGELEAFGRYYDVGDPMIPVFVTREPEEYIVLVDRKPEVRIGIWVDAIERWPTPSAMRKYGGLTPDSRRRKGETLGFNTDLRVMWFRLLSSLNKQRGKYYEFYEEYKGYLVVRYAADGVKILPTPRTRICPACEVEKKVPKDTRYCPDCGELLATKTEPEGVIWQGHVHMMCLRREAQLFNDHLWVVWREAEGLPLRVPYPMEKLGHTKVLTPWDMVDK